MTERRIVEFVEMYGLDGVYVSFSGGKDSAVLLHICRKLYPDIQAVFLDTWLEFPEIREFVKTFDNVVFIKPTKSMKEIVKEDGWCFPSKDVAHTIYYYRLGKEWADKKLNGLDKNGNYSKFRQQYKKWLPLAESTIPISHKCCLDMKEIPVQVYERKTKRHPLLALMAEESQRREQAYLRTGCNSFNSGRPQSKPLGFWSEQDILNYIRLNNLPIASPYGKIIKMSNHKQLFCSECKYTTSKEKRTGCMFCPIACHLDKFTKFERLKKSHPKIYDFCMEELNEKELIDFVKNNYIKF